MILKTYILHWLGGKTEVVRGFDIAHAMNEAGYGAGALAALDYYEEASYEQRKELVTCPSCGKLT